MNRYLIIVITSMVASFPGGTVARKQSAPVTESNNIPQPASYTITIQGITASGNTAFPQRRCARQMSFIGGGYTMPANSAISASIFGNS